MHDVTILHHPDDAEMANQIARELGQWGVDVGGDARVRLIVWTLASSSDHGFLGRAAETEAPTRISARFGPARLPEPFASEAPVNVLGWSMGVDHAGWTALIQRIAAQAYAPSAPQPASRQETARLMNELAQDDAGPPPGSRSAEPLAAQAEHEGLSAEQKVGPKGDHFPPNASWRKLPWMLCLMTLAAFLGYVAAAFLVGS